MRRKLNTTIRILSGVLLLMFASPEWAGAQSDSIFVSGEAGFSVKVKEEVIPYHVLALFLLPDEKVTFEVVESAPSAVFSFQSESGVLLAGREREWTWRAPSKKGLYPVTISDSRNGHAMILNVFVMIPYSHVKGRVLNGYQIGEYPKTPLKQLPIYKPPKGFVEVTKTNQNTLVSPHFRLKQFLCKQSGGHPKYLVLRERLVLKLELILEEVNKRGYRCNSFVVMSGYRTPYYNKAIGNVRYSRHVWGGAADIYIDEEPRDGVMDDLNKDGKIDHKDAAVLYDIIDKLYGKPWYQIFVGGLGRYKKTANHGPFVHVDVRGFRARWGS